MAKAFVFPGQGAQSIGMGQALAEAYPASRAVFNEVDDALGESLSGLIWDGDIETLTLTANAQPALMATSLAAIAALKSEGVDVSSADYVAGHSLGEYSVSGHKEAVERAVEIAKREGAKRAMLLPVSAPFHCALMEPAAQVMAEALDGVEVSAPVVPVVANVRAEAISDPQMIKDLLVEQVTGSVRWRESVAWMASQGVSQVFEIGAGKALSGMIRRIDRDIACQAVGDPDGVKAVAQS